MSKPLQRLSVRITAFFRMQGKVLLRTFLLLLTAAGIAAMLPHRFGANYQYQLNKPWAQRDLMAPFDFPVFKSTEQLQQEENAALQDFRPYYRLQTELGTQLLNHFKSQFADELSETAVARLSGLLTEAYKRGVLQAGPLGADGQFHLLNRQNKLSLAQSDRCWQLQQLYDAWKELSQQLASTPELSDRLLSFGIQQLQPNLVYDEALSEQMQASLRAKVSANSGMVMAGELIVSKGGLVTAEVYQKINSLERAMADFTFSGWQKWLSLLGQFLLSAIILGILVCYLVFFRKALFDDLSKLTVLLLNLLAVVFLFALATRQGIPSVYLIPLGVLPMLTRALFDAWLAMMVTLVATLICSFYAPYPAEFMVIQLAVGMAAIFSLISIRKRFQFYRSSIVVLGVYALCYTAYTLVNKGDFRELIPLYYGYFAVNALLTLIASPLLFGYEKVFGFVSDVTLMELADTNNALLRQLSYEAPGTFQHTLQVANLAEAAIYEIGGNALLVRVGALYHDIGKLTNPIYFIENQNADVNPHDDLPFEESAQIIIGHVLDGIQMAKKHKLPPVITDFIRTHHGDQRVEYFYQSHLRNFPEQEVDEGKFRYPGPKPFSKETAVLMMADSVEAASRSLKQPSSASIADLVDGIIDKQMQHQQFINADITLRDISRIKRLFKKMLNSIYHVRVAYPGQKSEAD